MRFTTSAGQVNLAKAEAEILHGYELGINYFDTAYMYPGNEVAVGEILFRNNLRDKINIATKLPHYLVKKTSDLDKFFYEELKRLKTDHIDYYLMHMLTDIATWERLKSLGIEEWIKGKKESGEIRQIGFSYHGNSDMFIKLVDAYPWEFCQIQYNYMDENSQAGVTGLKYANSKGLPVIIMEPLRGGKLVTALPKKAKELFNNYPVKRSPAAWGLKWLWNQPEVTCVLSGMNSLEMIEDNVNTASSSYPGDFTEKEYTLFANVVSEIKHGLKVGCTGCRYCMPCPQNVDIPGTFSAYNDINVDGYIPAITRYFMCTSLRTDYTGPKNCINCGKCETHCPQGIHIRDELKKARRAFELPGYHIVRNIVEKKMKY